MAEASLTCRDLTLGYHRRPAVHHLTGVVGKGSRLSAATASANRP
ncbi:hypothetical protein [Martelella sp. AMO21009]